MLCPLCQKQNRDGASFCSGCGTSLCQLDLCFVMDATGSMRKYIKATRDALHSFAQRLSTQSLKPKIFYGLVLYRDHPASRESPVTQRHPFSEDLEAFQQILNGVRTSGGGGDGAEAVAEGLYEACYRMKWRKHARKVILLVGDAPPHGYGRPRDRYPNGCECERKHGTVVAIAKNARQQGIAVFCLGIGADSFMKRSFEQIAECGGGQYVPVDSAITLIDSVLAILAFGMDNRD